MIDENIIEKIVYKKIDELNQNGYILPGHNGPYYDNETPVRNTSHFIIVFAHYYNKTNDKIFLNAIKVCADYLLSSSSLPMKGSFFCRYNKKRDFSNGTIGSSWAIEALVTAYEHLRIKKYLDVAIETFLSFPFVEEKGLWKILNVDGSIGPIDITFNHQLWFASAGTKILKNVKNNEIEKRCLRFFSKVNKLIRVRKNGLIQHEIFNNFTKLNILKSNIKIFRDFFIKLITGKSMLYKENGYHLFNVYAFATIKNNGFNIEFFNSKKFSKILKYCFSNNLLNWITMKPKKLDFTIMNNIKNDKINIYGFSYNAPGFEMPYIYATFSERLFNMKPFVKKIVHKQIELTYDSIEESFNKNTEDVRTLDARIYEYIKLYLDDLGKKLEI